MTTGNDLGSPSASLQHSLLRTLARVERSLASIARSDRLVSETSRRLELACNRIEVRAPAIDEVQAAAMRDACRAESDQDEIEREVRLTERGAAMLPAEALLPLEDSRA